MKNSQENRCSAYTPMPIMTARNTRASTTPTVSTRSWNRSGTPNRVISTRKTNRLSMLRLYSVIQAARNCPP